MNNKNLASILRERFEKARNGENWHNENDVLLPTGFEGLDEVLGGGLPSGSLVVIGAEPSFGKTTLTLQILEQMCELSGRPGLVVSLEMKASDLADKSLVRDIFKHNSSSPENCFCVNQLANRNFMFSNEQMEAYEESLERIEPTLSRISLVDEDDAISIIEKLETAIKNAISEFKKNPIVVIDYLQLIKSNNTIDKRLDVDETTNRIKKLCTNYNVTILLISSIGRTFYGKKLTRDAFKESGGIEFSADVLLGLQYQHLDDAKLPKPVRDMELAILKNRKCQQTLVQFKYFAKYDYFQEKPHFTTNAEMLTF